jgi:serine/threonine protein kinase
MEKSMIKDIPILKDLFPNEIKTLKILDSINIVKYVADEETPKRYFLAMEFCGDGDLASKL